MTSNFTRAAQANKWCLLVLNPLLLLPMLMASFQVFDCSTTWLDTTWHCYSSYHALIVALTVATAATFVLLCVFGAPCPP